MTALSASGETLLGRHVRRAVVLAVVLAAVGIVDRVSRLDVFGVRPVPEVYTEVAFASPGELPLSVRAGDELHIPVTVRSHGGAGGPMMWRATVAAGDVTTVVDHGSVSGTGAGARFSVDFAVPELNEPTQLRVDAGHAASITFWLRPRS